MLNCTEHSTLRWPQIPINYLQHQQSHLQLSPLLINRQHINKKAAFCKFVTIDNYCIVWPTVLSDIFLSGSFSHVFRRNVIVISLLSLHVYHHKIRETAAFSQITRQWHTVDWDEQQCNLYQILCRVSGSSVSFSNYCTWDQRAVSGSSLSFSNYCTWDQRAVSRSSVSFSTYCTWGHFCVLQHLLYLGSEVSVRLFCVLQHLLHLGSEVSVRLFCVLQLQLNLGVRRQCQIVLCPSVPISLGGQTAV